MRRFRFRSSSVRKKLEVAVSCELRGTKCKSGDDVRGKLGAVRGSREAPNPHY